MAKPNLTGIGRTYDINTINKLAMRNGIKPLTIDQFKSMSKKQLNDYLKATKKVNRIARADRRSSSRTFRKNAKSIASENLKQAQLMHGTIRQGLAELTALGTEGIGGAIGSAITRKSSASDAISQNTGGGTVSGDYGDGSNTEQGPVYAYKGRKEE